MDIAWFVDDVSNTETITAILREFTIFIKCADSRTATFIQTRIQEDVRFVGLLSKPLMQGHMRFYDGKFGYWGSDFIDRHNEFSFL